jgi:GNAT superfamily N-acetyltransferase
MSEDVVIRLAATGDLRHILRHRRRMFEDMGHRDEAVLNRMIAASEALLRDAIPRGTYKGWLAETASGAIAAGVGINIVPWLGSPTDPEPRRGWILNVYTEPEFRRRGLARRLMEALLEWCRADGFVTVSLHASADGRPLYELLGFQPTNEMRLRL